MLTSLQLLGRDERLCSSGQKPAAGGVMAGPTAVSLSYRTDTRNAVITPREGLNILCRHKRVSL
jgi:hypothetical protein